LLDVVKEQGDFGPVDIDATAAGAWARLEVGRGDRALVACEYRRERVAAAAAVCAGSGISAAAAADTTGGAGTLLMAVPPVPDGLSLTQPAADRGGLGGRTAAPKFYEISDNPSRVVVLLNVKWLTGLVSWAPEHSPCGECAGVGSGSGR
jgi:hypothetical protein